MAKRVRLTVLGTVRKKDPLLRFEAVTTASFLAAELMPDVVHANYL